MPLRFYNDFLGDEFNNCNLAFSGSDHEFIFEENLKKQSNDWYYKNTPINYYHNNLGHRSKDPNNLNFDDYILFSGCSHTYGVGIELEKSYPYLTAQKYNKDYYNLGLGGTGLDVMFYNVSLWLSRYPKPKHIFLQWSDQTRFLGTRGWSPGLPYTPEGHWSTSDTAKRFCVLGEETGYWPVRTELYYNLLKSRFLELGIGYTFVSFMGPDTVNLPEIFVLASCVDYARDLKHHGNSTNENLAIEISNQVRL